MIVSRCWEKSEEVFRYNRPSCVLDLTCLFPAALQGFYSRVHLWPDVPSGKLSESPAPGRVLHGGGWAVLHWKPSGHHAGGHSRCLSRTGTWLSSSSLSCAPCPQLRSQHLSPCVSQVKVAQVFPKEEGLLSRDEAIEGDLEGRIKVHTALIWMGSSTVVVLPGNVNVLD